MANHPSVPGAAQSGEHRIGVSVKTLEHGLADGDDKSKTAGVASRRFLTRYGPSLSSTLLTATTLLAATALFLAFPLLTFSFLSLALFLLPSALLPGGARFAWFVWIVLSFHITFHCYIITFLLILSRPRLDLVLFKSPLKDFLDCRISLSAVLTTVVVEGEVSRFPRMQTAWSCVLATSLPRALCYRSELAPVN